MTLQDISCLSLPCRADLRQKISGRRFLYATRKISFDDVVATMYRTGPDMNEKYGETAHGGLAQIYSEHLKEQEESGDNGDK